MLDRCKRILPWIDRFNDAVGRAGAWLVLGMVALMFAVAVLRYLFNLGWVWLQEGVLYMHATFFVLGMGYTLLYDGHVRVDIFYGKLGPRGKAWTDLLGTLLLLVPLCLLVLYYGAPYVLDAWLRLEGSPEAGGIPAMFLFKSLILAMPLLLLLQGFAWSVRALCVLRGDEDIPQPLPVQRFEKTADDRYPGAPGGGQSPAVTGEETESR